MAKAPEGASTDEKAAHEKAASQARQFPSRRSCLRKTLSTPCGDCMSVTVWLFPDACQHTCASCSQSPLSLRCMLLSVVDQHQGACPAYERFLSADASAVSGMLVLSQPVRMHSVSACML